MKAFTLLELTIVLLIMALLATFAMPAWQSISGYNDAHRDMAQLRRAINTARSEAIYRNQVVRLAPLGQWQQGYVMTIAGEEMARFTVHSHGAQIDWRSFPGYPYLDFTPQGFSNHQNGTFSYRDKHGQIIEKLIVSQSGRVRVEEYCTVDSSFTVDDSGRIEDNGQTENSEE